MDAFKELCLEKALVARIKKVHANNDLYSREPSVECDLYDTHGDPHVNLAEELIELNHAVRMVE